ncbi:MAG: GTPase ObgE [Deltaproteobacteria bacterium]|nr:MAG: GTPase ObgE [Deltaproteobacteria bacterium]
MHFVDRVRVHVEAGKGGDGAVAFRREAHVARGGPSGGDGGDGGDVVLVGDEGLSTLLDLRYRKHLRAEHGRPGGSKDRHGRSGEDLLVRVPLGTVAICEEELDAEADDARRPVPWVIGEVLRHGERLVIARGGRGGRGNIHFRGPTRQAPDEAEPGTPGEVRLVRLELKVLADVGLLGFPNVGKSTLLSAVSRARPKVADYPFTTLRPHLGVVRLDDERTMVLADVPGLIEGASEGRGLGHDFLRHLERTKVLLHVLAFEDDPRRTPLRDFEVIERELERHGGFAGRPRVVAVNKADVWTAEERAQVDELRRALPHDVPVFEISAATHTGLSALLDALHHRLSQVRAADEHRNGT